MSYTTLASTVNIKITKGSSSHLAEHLSRLHRKNPQNPSMLLTSKIRLKTRNGIKITKYKSHGSMQEKGMSSSSNLLNPSPSLWGRLLQKQMCCRLVKSSLGVPIKPRTCGQNRG